MDAGSTSRVLQFPLNWGADVVKFGVQNVLFSMLIVSNLARGGPSSDAGGLGSTGKEILGFQAWMTESTPRSDWSCGGKALAF